MRQIRRCFGAQIVKGTGRLKLVGFLSEAERKEFCGNLDNHTKPITMEQWKKLPKEYKYQG